MGIPVRPPAAERRGPTLWDGVAALLVVLAAGTLFFLLRPSQGNFLTACVVLDGRQVAEYRLSTLPQPERLTLDGALYPLTLEFAPDGVRVVESACPGQDCVHTGWVRGGGRIICLPNRLVVTLTGSGGSAVEFDAVTG